MDSSSHHCMDYSSDNSIIAHLHTGEVCLLLHVVNFVRMCNSTQTRIFPKPDQVVLLPKLNQTVTEVLPESP